MTQIERKEDVENDELRREYHLERQKKENKMATFEN